MVSLVENSVSLNRLPGPIVCASRIRKRRARNEMMVTKNERKQSAKIWLCNRREVVGTSSLTAFSRCCSCCSCTSEGEERASTFPHPHHYITLMHTRPKAGTTWYFGIFGEGNAKHALEAADGWRAGPHHKPSLFFSLYACNFFLQQQAPLSATVIPLSFTRLSLILTAKKYTFSHSQASHFPPSLLSFL